MNKLTFLLALVLLPELSSAGSTTVNPVKRVLPTLETEVTMTVTRAAYGRTLVGQICNVTQALKGFCNGTVECHIKADNSLCGDPAKGHKKEFFVEYACGNIPKVEKVKEGKTAKLDCYVS